MRKLLLWVFAMMVVLSGCTKQNDTDPEFIGTGVHQEFLDKGVITSTNDYYYTFDEHGCTAVIEEYVNGTLSYRSF